MQQQASRSIRIEVKPSHNCTSDEGLLRSESGRGQMRYISADEIAEAFEAYRNGITLDHIAGHLRITVAELRLVLGLPALAVDSEVAR